VKRAQMAGHCSRYYCHKLTEKVRNYVMLPHPISIPACERARMSESDGVNSSSSNLGCWMAPVLSTPVGRRLVFLIGFAKRELRWVTYSDSKNRLSVVQMTTCGISYNFSHAESGKVSMDGLSPETETLYAEVSVHCTSCWNTKFGAVH
jgi:hypothetical protein